MKTSFRLTALAFVALAAIQIPSPTRAQSAAEDSAAAAAPQTASAPTTRHLKLCAMLGLQVGQTYEFLISGNDDPHYWTIRSLGANGWILARDSRYPATWVNLSRVIAVSPVIFKPAAERPMKANRAK